jgi:hypothetical protein
MPEQKLNIVFTGDVSGLNKAIDSAESQLTSFEQKLKDSLGVNQFAQISSAVDGLKNKFASLSSIDIKADPSAALKAIDEVLADIGKIKGSDVVIKADNKEALAAIDDIESLFNDIRDKEIKLNVDTTGTAQATQDISKLKSDVNSLKGKVIPIDVNTDKAITGVKKLTHDLDGLATGSISQLRKAAAGLRTQLENLTPKSLKSDFGKDLSSALKTVETNLRSLEKESGITGEHFEDLFKKLGRQVGDFATFIPSIALGTALASASGLVEDFISKLFEGKMALNEFQKANSDALGRSGEETIKLEGLVSIARDLTLSTNERRRAVEELQKQYPDYLKNISLENINSAAATKSIDALTEATFNKALADQFATLAAKKNVEVFEKIQKIRSLADLKGSTKDKAVADLASTGIRLENQKLDKLITEREDLKQAFKDAQVDFFSVSKEGDSKKIEDAAKKLKEAQAALKKSQDDIIENARKFAKEFGNAFILPDLEDSFTNTRDKILASAEKIFSDLKAGTLKIKLPVQTNFDFIPVFGENVKPLTDSELQELSKGFFEGVRVEANIPVDVIPDFTLPDKGQQKQLDDLLKGFSSLGKLGFKEFEKIDFSNFNKGLKEGTKTLNGMLDIANTLNQSIGQGLTNAFNTAFDAALEGKNVFKALGEGLKQLVIGTIKAIAQMLILRAITNLIFPGAGGFIPGIRTGGAGQVAAPSFSGGIGGRSAPSLVATVRGADLAFVLQQGSNQIGRVG